MSAGHTPGPWQWLPYDEATEDMPKLMGANGKEVCSFGNDTTYYPSAGDPPSPSDELLMAAAPDLKDVAANFEFSRKDDGLWLILHGNGTTGRAMFNLGLAEGLAGQVATLLEQERRAALAKAGAS